MSDLSDRSWDLKQLLLQRIKQNGGWVNAHAHFDRAYSITPDTLHIADAHLHQKWSLVDKMKSASSVKDIYNRMAYATEQMIQQGVTAIGTYIDVDDVIEDKAIKAAQKLRRTYEKDVEFVFINQVLKGVINKSARRWFDIGAEFTDIIGGLPGKDKGMESEHLDILLGTAKRKGKMVHVHVDQLNSQKERETELLVEKTVQHGMQGQVVAVHCISVATHKKEYRRALYRKMVSAGVMVICCPIGWLDHPRTETLMPFHNSVTPVEEMVDEGITVAIGTDNIADIYKPFDRGSMWEELHFLIESLRFYRIDELIKIATENGRKVLGLGTHSAIKSSG